MILSVILGIPCSQQIENFKPQSKSGKRKMSSRKIQGLPIYLQMMILQAMGSFNTSSYAPLNIFLKADFLLNAAQVGLITGFTFIGTIFTSFLSGILVDRIGPRNTLAISFASFGLASFTAFLASSYYVILLAYVILGAGYGMVTPSTNSSIMHHYSPNHVRPMGIKQTGVPIGAIFSAVLLPFVATHFSVGVSYLVILLVSVVALFSMIFGKDSSPQPVIKSAISREELKNVFRNRTLITISAVAAFLAWSQQTVLSYYVIFNESGGTSVYVAEIMLAILLFGSISGRIIWTFSSNWILGGNLIRIFSLIVFLSGTFVILIPFSAGNMFLAIPLALALGMTTVAWNSTYVTIISEVASKGQVGIFSGLSLTILYTGAIIGTPLSGFIVDFTNSFVQMWLAVGTALLVLSVTLTLTAKRLRLDYQAERVYKI